MKSDFTFSFDNAEKLYKDLSSEYDSLKSRIDKILDSSHFYVGGFPVIRQIYSLSPTTSELKILSKALLRLSEIQEQYETISSKYHFIKTVTEDPNWIISSCADFSNDVDQIIGKIQESCD